MLKLQRSLENPILSPSEYNDWEGEGAFNGSIIKKDNKFYLLYRALSSPKDFNGVNMHVSSVGIAVSDDGVHFKERRKFIEPENEWEKFGCEDPRVTKIGNKYFIFYTALSEYPFRAEGIKVGVAITKDFKKIESKHLVTNFNAKAMALFPEKIRGKLTAILTVDTDNPPGKIAIATFNREEQIWSEKYWNKWYESLGEHIIPLLRGSADQVEVGVQPLKTDRGWLIIYSYIKNYFSSPNKVFGIEACILDSDNPKKVIGRTPDSLLIPEEKYELHGNVPNIVFPSGALIDKDKLSVYYGAADTYCALAECSLKDLMEYHILPASSEKIYCPEDGKKSKGELKRYRGNPIIVPRPEFSWERKAAFNTATLYLNDKVHLVYRAMSLDNTSVMGYASSSDGFHIDERLPEPIYTAREPFEIKKKPGNSGSEDPRLTKIGDRIYMLYTGFDGTSPTRVAMTSIKVGDFLNKNWAWKKSILISPPGLDNKNACLLSKKINGKYVFFHRMSNSIYVNFVKELEFKKFSNLPNPSRPPLVRGGGGVVSPPDKGGVEGVYDGWWLDKSKVLMDPRPDKWDNRKIGIAGPPIETSHGWLLIYHGVSDPGGIYKLGAVLLDSKNPAKLLKRTDIPVFEPQKIYEKEGQINNVVFSCGVVVIKDKLFVYYGGADKVIGVAVADLEAFMRKYKLVT